ncbi:MAG: ABC transporter permease, partial [Deltaproteobacteria bacterium]|nr:ABC transporter permease [Deltaproteobacteria bacterium]
MTLLIKSFLKRDFLSAISYKFGFLYEIGSLVSGILTIYFISSMIGDSKIESLEKYKTGYFSFSLLGIAFIDFMW